MMGGGLLSSGGGGWGGTWAGGSGGRGAGAVPECGAGGGASAGAEAEAGPGGSGALTRTRTTLASVPLSTRNRWVNCTTSINPPGNTSTVLQLDVTYLPINHIIVQPFTHSTTHSISCTPE